MNDPAAEDRADEGRESGQPSSSSGSLDGGRFTSGTVLAARYRIVGLAGRGGMGEVYRAEDLTLGEHVALKFLPPRFASDGEALARLHREVRMSRQITHRNVVRVHDVGEVDGQAFLSMEFVPGEDLASLLRRIGRLPEEKGIALARQICAGLNAAHERGVLHRDLKPANVMVDADGNAKISDFGLAAVADDAAPGERVGTPAYMAPEQLADGVTSRASDLFSLGLVLHEVFAGERAIHASTLSELHAVHATPLEGPAARVAGLDPAIDGAIRRCLAATPGDRPPSALAVAAALPGGDPLAEALAAGETPSPELVARGSIAPPLHRGVALALLVTGLLCFVATLWVVGSRSVFDVDGTPLEPAVLAHRARELLAAAHAPDLQYGVGLHELAPEYEGAALTQADVPDPGALRPALVDYVYRATDSPLAPTGRWNSLPNWNDPALGQPASAAVRLDSRGRLIELVVAHRDLAQPAAEPPDWSPWFEAAGVDEGRFHDTPVATVPPVWAAQLFAWEAAEPSADGTPLFVEAARVGPRLVWWRIGARDPDPPSAQSFGVALLVFAAMLLVGGGFAARNVRMGRADLRGATTLAAITALASLVGQLLILPGVVVAGGPSLLFRNLAVSLLFGAVVWVTYIALEPALRRGIPHTLTSWNRLLRRGWNDPLVHRDLLIGLVTGLVVAAARTLPAASADGIILDYPHGPRALWGMGAVVGGMFHVMLILVPVGLLFLFGLPRLMLRSSLAADVLGALLLGGFVLAFDGVNFGSVVYAVALFAVARWVGLVGLAALAYVQGTLVLMPVTWNMDRWWAAPSLMGPAALLVLLLVAFSRVARTQR